MTGYSNVRNRDAEGAGGAEAAPQKWWRKKTIILIVLLVIGIVVMIGWNLWIIFALRGSCGCPNNSSGNNAGAHVGGVHISHMPHITTLSGSHPEYIAGSVKKPPSPPPRSSPPEIFVPHISSKPLPLPHIGLPSTSGRGR